MTTELKPCPFCGGKAKICQTSVYWVKCTVCKAVTNWHCRKVEAVAAWNRRANNEQDAR